MGRPGKPIAQHILQGTYRPDRHALSAEATGEPSKPEGLTGEAGALWDDIVPQLVASGIAKAVDGPALLALCRWWQVWREIDAKLQATPSYPLTMQASAAWKAYSAIASKFGLDPSSRASLKVPPPPKTGGVAQFARNRGIPTRNRDLPRLTE